MKAKTNKIISFASIAMAVITLALVIFTIISFNSKDSKIDRAYHENRIAELDEQLASNKELQEDLNEYENALETLKEYGSSYYSKYYKNYNEYSSAADTAEDVFIRGKTLSYEQLIALENAEERNKTLLTSTIISLICTLVLFVITVVSKRRTNSNTEQEMLF